LEPVKKVSIIDQVVSKLCEYIKSNEIYVGEKLPTEKELCERLGVGRSTIREAFRILQALGYVDMKPGRGAFVSSKTEAGKKGAVDWFVQHGIQIADFMEVRLVFEPLAVRLAAERATKREKEELEKIHKAYTEALNGGDPATIATYSEEFHNKIAEASKNKLLISINAKIADAFFVYRCRGYSITGHCKRCLNAHQKILDAIKNNDVNGGEEAMKEHINSALDDLSIFMKKVDE
jgi:GntR family transcriptional repressor for pyruvate dehydrogenase complex